MIRQLHLGDRVLECLGTWVFVIVLVCLSPRPSCAQETGVVRLRVPVTIPWSDTGVDLEPGESFSIQAEGQAQLVGVNLLRLLIGHYSKKQNGPEGTYVWPKGYPEEAGPFALPALDQGPAPAFSLIGRFDKEGEPFYVGRDYQAIADYGGRLWLGINDDQFEDNRGAFTVTIQRSLLISETRPGRPIIQEGQYTGRPVPDARVLVVYVDGLRPDVVHELADAGFLPNFKNIFIDQGIESVNAFTLSIP